ncbi:fimbrial protein [Acinetobacter sp. Ver3]|uniref:fimbrial protein n=1 Tax=Acinetobacter sp. Ver3 TaxID=466088 RepID=UPI00044C7835|nr:fimbrial protein [Acinetobacter sp. Ver3]EZQ10518.1 fimbrial protein [Acinetobacter sp. Ver3]
MKTKILIGAVVLSGFAITSVQAACTPQANFRTVDISMAVGRVVVRPSDPVGRVLTKKTFPISPNGSSIRCDRNPVNINARLIQNGQLSPAGDSVYETNIPGIGIRLYREAANNQNFSGYYPYSRRLTANTTYNLDNGFFVVEIIKTAVNSGSGVIAPGRYSTYYVEGYPQQAFLTSTVYGNAITIASSSCEIQGNINKTVNLPTVNKSDFKGIGSTAGEQAFDMNILCNGGDNPTSVTETNRISLSFDYTSNGNNSIVNDAASNVRAKGVNTQLISNYQNQNKVITQGEQIQLGTVSSNQTVQYNLPLKARYIQVENQVEPGRVRGQATVTIQYQ